MCVCACAVRVVLTRAHTNTSPHRCKSGCPSQAATHSAFRSASVWHHAAPAFQRCSSRIPAIFWEIFYNLSSNSENCGVLQALPESWVMGKVEFQPGGAYGTARVNMPSRHLPECLWIPSGPWVSRPCNAFQPPSLPRLSEAVLRIRDSGVGCLRQKQLQGGGGGVTAWPCRSDIKGESGNRVLWRRKREVVVKWCRRGLRQMVYRLKSSWMMLACQDDSVSKLENQPLKKDE